MLTVWLAATIGFVAATAVYYVYEMATRDNRRRKEEYRLSKRCGEVSSILSGTKGLRRICTYDKGHPHPHEWATL